MAQAETRAKEQARKTARMRGEVETMGNLFLQLPDTVRELNRADLDPGEVPRLIVRLARRTDEHANSTSGHA